MLTQVIWWTAIFLEGTILIRGMRRRLLKKFPIFYGYIFSVLVVELLRFFSLRLYPKAYPSVYWDTQFVSLVVGCGIIFEIYRAGLREFPGTARMARNLLLFVFAMVFAKAIATSTAGSSWLAAFTAMTLERDLRIVQTVALTALVVLFLLYAIPLSRNLRGMLYGYGVFLGTSVLQLTLMVKLGQQFHGFWGYLRSGAYLLVLLTWTIGLWTYQETPKAAHKITLDEDYKMLVAGTRRRFQKTRLALGKAVRP
jgi:hypothetical protein